MDNVKSPIHDTMIIPDTGDKVKSLTLTLSEMGRHKTLAQDIQNVLAEYYLEQGKFEKSHWIPLCGSWLLFERYHNAEQTLKLKSANYCHHQLCPMCAWRKHAKNGALLSAALEGMDSLYMVTMTIDNTEHISRERLRELIKQSTAMLRSMSCPDYIANLEVTYSQEKGFHPHVHAIVYQPSWDRTQIGANMAYWRKKWGQKMAGKHGYNILHIEPIDGLNGAIAEVTKYLCKPMTPQEDIVPAIRELIPAVRRVRQIRAGGIIRERIAGVKESREEIERIENRDLWKYSYQEVVARWINGEYDIQNGKVHKSLAAKKSEIISNFDPSRVGVEICGANTTRP